MHSRKKDLFCILLLSPSVVLVFYCIFFDMGGVHTVHRQASTCQNPPASQVLGLQMLATISGSGYDLFRVKFLHLQTRVWTT